MTDSRQPFILPILIGVTVIGALFGCPAAPNEGDVDDEKRTTMHILNDSGLTPEALAALVSSDGFAGATYLDISSNPVGPAGLRAIGSSPRTSTLETLYASGVGAGDEGMAALAASEQLSPVALNVSDNGISAAGVRALTGGRVLAKLELLDLSYNPIGDPGAKALAASPDVAALQQLNLASCELGDAGVAALVTSPHLPRLETLMLPTNALSPAAIASLADPSHLPALTKLWIPASALDDAGKARLARARPSLKVELQH